MAVIFNLEVNVGAGLIETFIIRDKNGDPVNLGGYEASVTFFNDYGESELLSSKTTDVTPKIEITGVDGQIAIEFPDSDLISFPTGNEIRWHLDIWDSSLGETYKTREIRGNCVVIGTSSDETA